MIVLGLSGFSICVPVPVIRGPTRFLTMAEVAEVEDGVVIIDCVAIFYEEGEGGEHYRKKNNFRCRVSRISKKTPCKVKRENLVSLPLTGSLRSRRLEVVGTRNSRAPVLSFAHSFQAFATQTILTGSACETVEIVDP